MAWNIIRTATAEETLTLTQKAVAFAERHASELHTAEYESVSDLEGAICIYSDDDESARYTKRSLRKLWKQIVSRTLGTGAEGIVNGYVGYHIN